MVSHGLLVIFESVWQFLLAYNDGLVQDCSISIANALEILQSCTKPSIWCNNIADHHSTSWWHSLVSTSKECCSNDWISTSKTFAQIDMNCEYDHVIWNMSAMYHSSYQLNINHALTIVISPCHWKYECPYIEIHVIVLNIQQGPVAYIYTF